MDKLTVCEVTGTMNFGGAEIFMMNVFRKLHDKFNFVFVIVTNTRPAVKGDFDDEIISLGGKIVYVDSMRRVGKRKYVDELVETFSIISPNVVHCHLNAKCGLIAKCAHIAGVKKIISHSHARLNFKGFSLQNMYYRNELRWQRKLINKYSTDFWACSEDALNSLFYKDKIEGNKCKVIYNPIESEKFLAPNRDDLEVLKTIYNPEGKFALGVVGRFAPVKNQLFALDVLKDLNDSGFDCVLFLIGSKQFKEYANNVFEKINDLGLQDKVIYVPPKTDIELYYPLFDVYLGTSLREGASLTAIEAQLSGCYSIVSNGYLDLVDLGVGLCKKEFDFNVKNWVNDIINIAQHVPFVSIENRKKAVVKKGFDLTTEAKSIEKEYSSL